MFKVTNNSTGQVVGFFAAEHPELQLFDTRCFTIEPAQKAEPRPFVLMVHVRQERYDESGSRLRLMAFSLKPGEMIDALRITATGHLMKL